MIGIKQKNKYILVKKAGLATLVVVAIAASCLFMYLHGNAEKKVPEDIRISGPHSFDLTIPFESNEICPHGGVIKKHAKDLNGDGLPQKEEWKQGKEVIECYQS